jgi:hypothetical protein
VEQVGLRRNWVNRGASRQGGFAAQSRRILNPISAMHEGGD